MGHTGDELVPQEVSIGTRTEEDIRFIKQQHRVPQPAKIKSAIERGLDLAGHGPKCTRAHGVQGHARPIRDGLGGEGLSNTGRAKHEDDDATA